MASSLLALLDDITTILDDVAVLTKTSAAKTTGVMTPRSQSVELCGTTPPIVYGRVSASEVPARGRAGRERAPRRPGAGGALS